MRLRDKVKEQAMQMREGDNQRSPLKGRFARFIRHRMKWHASEYYRKHKPRENVSPLDDVEDQLYDPQRWMLVSLCGARCGRRAVTRTTYRKGK